MKPEINFNSDIFDDIRKKCQRDDDVGSILHIMANNYERDEVNFKKLLKQLFDVHNHHHVDVISVEIRN